MPKCWKRNRMLGGDIVKPKKENVKITVVPDKCKGCSHYSDGKCTFFIENGPPYGKECIGFYKDEEK